MKNIFILLLSLFFVNISNSQEMFKMKIENGTKNEDLRQILNFENIYIDNFKFVSKDLIGKNYEILIIEFKNGKIVSNTVLFESSELDLFRIKNKKFSFKLLSKFINKTKLKIAFDLGFGSKTLFFDLIDTKFEYIMKDFLESKREVVLPLEKDFYLTSIISPTMHEDGSASYCEVVSTKNPEKIGEEYKIPHYFLIKMKFKD